LEERRSLNVIWGETFEKKRRKMEDVERVVLRPVRGFYVPRQRKRRTHPNCCKLFLVKAGSSRAQDEEVRR